jgi:hypothetical protein
MKWHLPVFCAGMLSLCVYLVAMPEGRSRYLLFLIALLVIEICIALFMHDRFVRPWLGDLLVAILLYCAAQSVFLARPQPVATATLLFCFLMESLQAIDIVKRLGLEEQPIFTILIGRTFAWSDVLAYCGGTTIVLLAEAASRRRRMAVRSR